METPPKALCACGCGKPAFGKSKWAYGHWQPANPSGLCLCGCGQKTELSDRDHQARGYRKGDPLLYIRGHHVGRGEDAPRWKGGRWKHKGGYIYLYVPDHPAANRDGCVYEHRVIAERTLGRYLVAGETVHHKNGIKDDNRSENLVVIENQSEHARIHSIKALDKFFETHDRKQFATQASKKGHAARWGKKP